MISSLYILWAVRICTCVRRTWVVPSTHRRRATEVQTRTPPYGHVAGGTANARWMYREGTAPVRWTCLRCGIFCVRFGASEAGQPQETCVAGTVAAEFFFRPQSAAGDAEFETQLCRSTRHAGAVARTAGCDRGITLSTQQSDYLTTSLTNWYMNKMADILQTAFLNTFSWADNSALVQLAVWHWTGITWTSDDLVQWCTRLSQEPPPLFF